jgi:hypothetical protein
VCVPGTRESRLDEFEGCCLGSDMAARSCVEEAFFALLHVPCIHCGYFNFVTLSPLGLPCDRGGLYSRKFLTVLAPVMCSPYYRSVYVTCNSQKVSRLNRSIGDVATSHDVPTRRPSTCSTVRPFVSIDCPGQLEVFIFASCPVFDRSLHMLVRIDLHLLHSDFPNRVL